jgi:hypothetical protein
MRRTWIETLARLGPAALALTLVASCGGGSDADTSSEGLRILADGGVTSLAFISRPKRLGVGDVFQYTSFSVDPRSANIMRLDTVSGGADADPITPFGTDGFPKADIMAMDVSFDGKEIVFSARLEGEDTYDLYRIKIDGTNPDEPGKKGPSLIHTGPYDSVYPVYLPNDRIFFMTNETPAEGIRQFRDEYERGLTAQAATIDKRGGNLELGPRNLSHRVSPTLVSLGDDNRGQILYTNWDHIVDVNEGNLMVMNPDMTGSAEFFGKEGSGVANSYLKARQINDREYLAIGTARERTFQAGAIIKVDRGTNEASAAAEILTPDVPLDREPSFDKVGRYYDAYPITDGRGQLTHVLTSWANGPVQSDVAAGGEMEGINYGEGAGPPDFGLFVLDPGTGKRLPIYNDPDMWDVMPLPIGGERTTPTSPAGSVAETPDGTALVGALNVLESSIADGSQPVYRVRVIEGFSTEEGVPMDFGLTEADGAILLGEAPVFWDTDHSFAAFVPEDRPIHLQTLDAYGMRVTNEDRWFSAAPGEQRFCGGCHEARNSTQVVDPGLSDAVGAGPANLALPYDQRRLADPETRDWAAMAGHLIWPDDQLYANAGRIQGLPWDMAVQQVLDAAACGTCHDGEQSSANPSVSITDAMADGGMGATTTWTFNLTGEKVTFEYGMMTGEYTASHISLLLMAGLMAEEGVTINPEVDENNPYQAYVVPQSARDSVLIRYVQPEQLYPTYDAGKLAFAGEMRDDGQSYAPQHPSETTPGYDAAVHRPLTAEEKYILILAADLGGQYYSLENAPGQTGYEGQ